MEPWEELLLSSTRDDEPKTSPLAWFFFFMRDCVITWQPCSMLENGFHTEEEEEAASICLIFWEWVTPHGHLPVIPLIVSPWYSCLVPSGETIVPVHTLPTAGIGEDPFQWRPCYLEGVVKSRYNRWHRRNLYDIICLKCQVTITWFSFKTLFTKVSRWPFKWRCLPGFTTDDTILIDSPPFT